jgi:predicted fused transcriptional regulator/phosphomethylpyrimidine kinase/hydrogenase maturation factor
MDKGLGKLRIKRSLNGFSSENYTYATAPAIGLPEDTLPFFSLSYALGNIYAKFSEPLYVFDEILLPPDDCEKAIKLYETYLKEAENFDVKVIGGHTGCYDGLEMPLIVTNAVGRKVNLNREKPTLGDDVLLIGKPFLESEWLEYLAGKSYNKIEWRKLTPVNFLKALYKTNEVKLLHDVSEGGLWGALLEIQENIGLGIRLDENFYELLGGRSAADPSYGTVIAIADKAHYRSVCNKFEDCAIIGEITRTEEGLTAKFSSELVELYGAVSSWDVKLNKLAVFLKKVKTIKCLSELIPEVGTNVVLAESAGDPVEKIAGVDGRIVRSVKGIRVGKPAYGSSKHMALVLKEAMKSDPSIRVAINLRLHEGVVKVLKDMGYVLQEVKNTDSYCPVLEELKQKGLKSWALVEPPGYGLEGNIVLFSKDLDELLKLLARICESLQKLFS